MDDKYGWISQLTNSTAGPHNVFSVITVGLSEFISQGFILWVVVTVVKCHIPVDKYIYIYMDYITDPTCIIIHLQAWIFGNVILK